MIKLSKKKMDLILELNVKLDAFLLDFKPCVDVLDENDKSLSQLKERLSEQLKMLAK